MTTQVFPDEDIFRSFKPCTINGYNFNSSLPDIHLNDYKRAISSLCKKFSFIPETFHQFYPGPPYTIEGFLDYMKASIGLGVTVISFDGTSQPRISGTWAWADEDKRNLKIWVNGSHTEEKQRVTIIHECIHAIQDFDRDFISELSTYPIAIQCRIADRIAEKTAIEILMPKKPVLQDKAIGLNVYQIANKYKVSRQMAEYA